MQRQANPERIRAGQRAAAAEATPHVPLLHAAGAQACAALLLLALAAVVPGALANDDLMTWALLQGIVAASLGRVLGMDNWWLPIHALFAPGLVWALQLGLPPGYALAAFGVLASLYWGVSRTRVPLFLSSRDTARALVNVLPQGRTFSFIDLGCGFGGVLASLAGARADGNFHGIEAAPVPYIVSRLRAALGPHRYAISFGDLRKLDLGRYDVVYAYLSPAAMPELWRKARREMRAGTLLVSNGFTIPGVSPTATIETGTRETQRLLLWRM